MVGADATAVSPARMIGSVVPIAAAARSETAAVPSLVAATGSVVPTASIASRFYCNLHVAEHYDIVAMAEAYGEG